MKLQMPPKTGRTRYPHPFPSDEEIQMKIQKLAPEDKQALLDLADGIPNRIKLAVENAGVTNADIAREMDVKERTVYEWCKSGQISKERLPLLCALLDVPLDWVLTGKTTEYLVPHTLSDQNVVEFKQQAKFEGVDMPMINRFLPAISTAEMAKGKDHVDQIVQDNYDNPGQRLGISVAFWNANVPGIPKFSMQIILGEFGTAMPLGTMIGIADDISPINGDFIVGRHKDGFVGGFFFPMEMHLATSDRAGSWKSLPEFLIQKDKFKESRSDIITSHENFELVGVATYQVTWNSPTLIEEQTHLRDRMNSSFETRRLE